MILATTIGEIVGNLISRNLGLGYSTGALLLISAFLVALITAVFIKTENHIYYWILIILGNIAGTNCADFITIEPLQLGTIYGSLLVMGVLIALLVLWHIITPKSSIEKGLSTTAEYLYWFAILASSTFGTTFGDYLSNDTILGSSGGTILLLMLLALISILLFYKKISKELFYWLAIVIIHPIGATSGNYLSKPEGLNFGNIWTSIALIMLFIVLFWSKKSTALQTKN
jgi:uncharacterized membrane-anchored protein